MLTILDELPGALLQCDARQLISVLSGPTLIHLEGQRKEVLFISVLLHGNEITGWEALRSILSEYRDKPLPRSLCLFIGNVAAAAKGWRCLPGQADYNRIWKAEGIAPEHPLVREVQAELADMRLFAAIDIHNNSGMNPHYACINRLDAHFLHLARLFSRTIVYFIMPDEVMSLAMAAYCPSVTLECGQPGEMAGVVHAREFMEACLHLSVFSDHALPDREIDLFHTVATIKVKPDTHIGLAEGGADFSLLPDMDKLNFTELPAGSLFGWSGGQHLPLQVWDERGREMAARYFEVSKGEIITRTPLMPSMLSLDREIIRQDCLCYLMERLPLAQAQQKYAD
ncbi:MAG TPA: peptidase M14 [Gammaproteobacteria bacterium]|nr:peptidase M14 [Gammaproteobacteria bacterium]